MQPPRLPEDEDRRLHALRQLEVLDTAAEERFDRITRVAQRYFGVAIALVSLVDAERQWFKSKQGLSACETGRNISFCGHAILEESIFCIPDALEDARFSDNPLVTGAPHIRFYAGAPLHAPDGQRVGTLCIIDPQPHTPSAQDLAVLRDLADTVEAELARSHLLGCTRHATRLALVAERTDNAVIITDATGRVEWVNLGFEKLSGYALAELMGKKPGEVLQGPDTDPATVASMRECLSQGAGCTTEILNYRKNGTPYWLSLSIQPIHDEKGRVTHFIAIESDISEHKQASARLADNEARIRAIFDTVVDGIISINSQGLVQTMNPAAQHLFGYTSDEMVGRNVSTLMPEPYRSAHDGYLHQYLTTGKKKIIGMGREVCGLRKDGSTFPMELAVNEMRIAGERMFTGVVRDISQRKLAQAQLQAMAAWQDAILNSANFSIIATDPSGVIQTFSRGAEDLLGYRTPDMVGKQTPALFHDPDEVVRRATELSQELGRTVEPGFEAFVAKARLGAADEREWTYVRKDGARVPVWLSVTAMRDAQGQDLGFIGIAHDITQRKALENEAKRYAAVVQTTDDAIMTKTLEGTITSWNHGAERMFGYSAQEAIGQPMRMLFPDDRAHEEQEILEKIARGERVDHFETVRRRKDGSALDISVTISPLVDSNGEITGASKIARNISERKKVERMKSEFVSTVSHELRTPLTSIRGALGLALGHFADAMPPKARQMLEMAERNSERLTLLINDILDLEKIESGRLEFEFRPEDLVLLAQRALEDNEGYARRHNVQLRLNTTLSTATVFADAHRLLQVFANLISNAVKYSPDAGTVEIAVIPHAKGYRFSVRDHGNGIPESFKGRIFQRFAQADSSDTRQKGGTGLGLSITKAIVERHGGAIAYTSEPGQGTEFFVDLSAWQAMHEDTSSRHTTVRALVCEDNSDVAQILAQIVGYEGLACDIAATANAARELLSRHDYRLMLLDLNLPDADGLQFLQELRATPTTRDLPVVVVSGRALEGRSAYSGDAVAVIDWLQKPVERERLQRALHSALQRTERPRILHVEDDPDIVQVTQLLLEDMVGYSHVATLHGARQLLAAQDFDLVLLDLTLADGSGIHLLEELKGRCPVVIFSAQTPVPTVTEQVTAVLTKSQTSNDQLQATIRNVLATT